MGIIVSTAKAIASGANIANTLNNFVRDIEAAITESEGNAGLAVWDILDATAGLLVFGGAKPSLLLTGDIEEIWTTYRDVNTPALARKSFYTRMKERHDQIATDANVVVTNNQQLATQVEKTLEDTVIEMIEGANTLMVTTQMWADYALLNLDKYPNLISDIHYIIVGPLEPEDTTENPNVVPFNSINDVYQGYTSARTFTLQTEITTIGRATFSSMQSLEEIIVETEQDNGDGTSNGREHQYYSSVDGILFSKDGTILIAYPPNRKEDGVVATTYSIPNSVLTIGEDAFAGTKLIEIYIPDSVSVIGARAFEHMHNLTQINVQDTTKQITFNADTTHATDGILLSASSFSDQTYATTVGNESIDEPTTNNFYESMSALIVPQGQYIKLYDENDTQIGEDLDILFSGKLSQPDALSDEIGLTATKMVISKNTQTFLFTEDTWKHKFRNIADITLEASDQGVDPYFTIINGVLYDYAKTVAFKYPPLRSPGTNTELVLESTITRISACAFYDMRHITKITIPASVTVIGTSAFMHGTTDGKSYSSLTEVIFSSGSNLKTIQRHAFQNCNTFYNAGFVMTLPRSVVTIEAWGFWGARSSITFEAGSKLNKIGYQSLQYAEIESRLPEGLKSIQQDGLDGAKHMSGGPLYIPASVEDLYPNSLKMGDSLGEIHFAKRSQVTGITLDNDQNLRTPFYSDTEIYVYGPLLDRLGWGVTNTWTQQSHGTTNWSSAWNLRGSPRVHHKYSSVVNFTMSTTTLVAGDSPTVNIQFSEPEVDFDRNLDITIFDTNTGSITSDLGTLSEMTTVDGGTNWSGIFTPPVDTVNNGLELRLDNVYYRNNDSSLSDASVAFSMNTTRTPLTMYMLSKNLVKDGVAEIVIVFPDASSGTSFSMDRVSIYNSDVTPVLKNEYEGQVWTTSYTLTAAATADISYFGFVPNRVIYNTTIVEEQLTLTLVGDNSVSSEFNTIESYTDPAGAIVTNSQGVQLYEYTSQVSAEVNRGILDTYYIIYNFPLTNSVTRTVTVVDTTQPYINNTTITSDNSFIDVTFSEAVYSTSSGSGTLGVSNFALSISGGVATISPTPTTVQANGNVYTLGISLSGVPDGNELVTVVPSTSAPIYDVVGNVSNSTVPNNNNTVLLNDKASPSMEISATNATSGDTVNHAVNLVFTVSEAIADFVASDIILVGGTISALNNSGIHYTTTFTPTSNAEGACSVSVLTGSFEDLEGRANIVDSVFSFTSNTTGLILYSSGSTIFTKAMWQAAGSPTSFELGTGWTEIGTLAFKQTNIASITIPASVTSIGEGAFESCTTLASITIPASVQIIGKEAFYYATNLTSVTFAADSGLLTIGEGAFQNSGLTSIAIPASVTTMENLAFQSASDLVSVTFAAGINLTYIKNNTFQYTGITSIEIPASVTDVGQHSLSNNSNLTSVTFAAGSGLTQIQANALAETAITSIEIPASVTDIGQKAFELCTSLTAVAFLPSANWNVGGIVHVGFNSFLSATSLATVFIKDGQVFGSPGTTYNVNTTGAFFGSPATTTLRDINSYIPYSSASTTFIKTMWQAAGEVGDVILGEGWTEIGDYAFQNTNITSIIIPASVTTLGVAAFKDASSLASVTFAANSGLLYILLDAFRGTGLTSIVIPASVTDIGVTAFDSCSGLASVTFADIENSELLTIGTSAFGDTGITSIVIPASVTYMGSDVFNNTTSLTRVYINDGQVFDGTTYTVGTTGSFFGSPTTTTLRDVNSYIPYTSGSTTFTKAMWQAAPYNSPTVVELGEGWTSIGDNAFENTALTSIIIPASVQTIGDSAFRGADLTSVTFAAGSGLLTIGISAFQFTVLTSIIIPASVTDIGQYSLSNNSNLTSVTFATGSGLLTIGRGAFGWTGITSITIPASVTTIEYGAFKNVTSIASVTFATGSVLETIGDNAFEGIAITSITIPASVTSIGSYAFYLCVTLTTVTFAAGSGLLTIGDFAFASNTFYQTGLTSIEIPASVTSIGDDAFFSVASLATVTFAADSGLLTIGDSAFGWTGITSITIPASVTTILKSAFMAVTSLTSVTFAAGSGLLTIGEGAFSSTAITSIIIPASVTSIGDEAFQWAGYLTDVTFIESTDGAAGITFGTDVFDNTAVLTTIFIKDGQKFNGTPYNAGTTGSFFGSPATTTTDSILGYIPYTSGSTTFTNAMWVAEGSHTEIELGEGWTSIGDNAFENTALTSIAIPASVQTIGDSAFGGAGLTSIVIPASVTSIGVTAFDSCSGLASVAFAAGSGLLTIGDFAFQSIGITSIDIPASVQNIGNNAFKDDISLTTVTFLPSADWNTTGITTMGADVFTGATSLATVLIKDGQVIAGTTYTVGTTGSFFGSPAMTTTDSIDDVPPTAAITYDSTSPYKNGDTVIITATFSESMDGTTIPKIIVTGSGIADLSATNMTRVTSTEYTYSYSVPIGNGSGVITLSTGTDLFGNIVTAVPTSGSSFTVDNVPPTAAITYDSTSPYKNGDTVIITATFSESMDGTTIPKIIVTGSGIADLSATNMTRVTSTEYTYSYSVPIGDGSGVITLSTGTDLTGNLITAAPTSGSSFTVDNTQPTLSSVLLVSDYTDITKAGIGSKITLTFTASEQIQTPTVAFNVGNTAVTGSITITNTGGNAWSAVYYVGANHPSGALAYTIDHSDIVGNQGTQVTSGSGSVTVDTVRPTFTSISIASNNSTTSLSKPGNDVILTMAASKTIQSPSVVFTSGSVAVAYTTPTIANTSGDTWTATYTTDIADTDGSVAFTVTYTDIYGNDASAVATAVTDGTSVTFDKTLPTVSSFVMDDVALKNGETASVALTFSEAVPGFNSDSYVTVANGTMTTMTSNAENKVWTAVFTPTAALESVTNVLTLTSGYTDVAGNASTHAAIQTPNYAIDTIQPVTASVTPITFKGTPNVINRKPSFVFSSTQGGTITTSNATFSTTTTAVSGNNTITFDRLADYTTHDAITIIVTDPAGNPSVALTVPSFTVDTTIKTVDVITAVSSATTLTDTLTSIGVDQTDKSVEIHPTTNPYASYKARITLPNGDFAALTDANKVSIKGVIMELYAAELDIVSADTLFVDLIEGSVIADVYVMTPEAVSSNIQICFPKGTPVTTNQGEIPIEDIIPGVHTIRGKKITAITCTQPNTEHIVLIKKHALGKNVPCASTHISNHHRVFYKGKMVKAIDLVNMCEGVMKTPYNGETLYNVVMRKHDKMMINNLICETLHPDNVMARICAGDYTHREKVELCNMLKRIGKTSDYNAYNRFYASLK